MTIAASTRRTSAARLSALCPCTAVRPFRSWLIAITILWVVLWAQLGVAPPSWNRLLALILFGVACGDTVLYGMTVPRRHERPEEDPGLLSSSVIGVLTLAAVSWVPFLLLGVGFSLGTWSIAPLAAILIFGLPVSLVLAVAGFLLLLVLLVLGRVLVWVPASWRSALD